MLVKCFENLQDTKAKLAQVTSKVEEMREEGEQIRLACQEMIKKYQVIFLSILQLFLMTISLI